MCQPSRDWPLSLSTDWRWDLEEKLLLLCLLYGSFFTLNAENLFRGHRIPASPRRPQLILAALGIDKAFSGAKYAAYVLQLSSLYFPPASLLGLAQHHICRAFGNVNHTWTQTHTRAQGQRVDRRTLICERRGPIQLVIRDSIARMSHKTPAFMAWLLSFCLQLWWLLISPYLPPLRPSRCT